MADQSAANTHTLTATRITNRRYLPLLRWGWVIITVGSVAAFIVSVPAEYRGFRDPPP